MPRMGHWDRGRYRANGPAALGVCAGPRLQPVRARPNGHVLLGPPSVYMGYQRRATAAAAASYAAGTAADGGTGSRSVTDSRRQVHVSRFQFQFQYSSNNT